MIGITIMAAAMPDGRPGVLIQVAGRRDGWLTMTPDDADHLAARLIDVAERVRQSEAGA
jgi:hypothetical protein